jgi:hypothetical protein
MWNFFAAPSKLFDEIQRQLADLHASSNDKDPNLAIQFEPSRHVVMHESGGAGTFRVEAVNTSQKTISGVSIRIVSIAGDTEERTREYQKFVGLRLATTVDPTRETRGRDNMPADEVDLYPGGYQIYDLARLTRSGVSLYHSNYERNKQTQNLDQVPSGYIPAGRVEIGLMAVSRDVNSKIKRFVARRSH